MMRNLTRRLSQSFGAPLQPLVRMVFFDFTLCLGFHPGASATERAVLPRQLVAP